MAKLIGKPPPLEPILDELNGAALRRCEVYCPLRKERRVLGDKQKPADCWREKCAWWTCVENDQGQIMGQCAVKHLALANYLQRTTGVFRNVGD